MHRKINPGNEPTSYNLKKEKEETVWMLVLTEIMEIGVPLAYAISFVLAYYGPNSRIIGNV